MKKENVQIEIVDPKDYGLTENQAEEVEKNFLPVIADRENYEGMYRDILAREITLDLTKEARELRLKLVKVRTKTSEIHQVTKAFYLAGGRFVDAWKNKNVKVITEMEESLRNIEDHYENIERERISKLAETRRAELLKYSEILPEGLGGLSDEVYQNYLTGVKAAHQAKIDAEIAELKKQAERQRVLALHNSRKDSVLHLWQFMPGTHRELNFGEMSDNAWKELLDYLKSENVKHEADQAAVKAENERLRKAQEEKEKELAAEKKRAEDARKAAEAKAAEEKRKADAELRKAQEENARVQRELDAREKEEKKAATDAMKAEKKARRAPDKEKLHAFAVKLSSIEIPEVKSEEAQKILIAVTGLIEKTVLYLNEKTEEL